MSILGRLRQLAGRPEPYDPETYWERRSHGLIDAYAHPETWEARGWNIRLSPEARLVPELLERYGADSILVAGAGTGRQYAYLAGRDLAVRGFDLSPTMVEECRRAYPDIATTIDNVIGSDLRQAPADAVLAVTVLQHVPAADIAEAVRSLRALAAKLAIFVEHTRLGERSSYVFAHDYEALMGDWELVARADAAVAEDGRMELLAWRRPS